MVPPRLIMSPEFFLNRELGILEFNRRVLAQAEDARNPLLERLKFLAIFASNLDEFFQVRVSTLRRAARSNRVAQLSDGGRSPAEQLAAVREEVSELVEEQSKIYRKLRRLLAAAGIEIVDYAKVPEHHAHLRDQFLAEIYPVLTPLAVDPGHPFPYITSLTLSVAVALRDPATDERHFARVKVPPLLPRLLELPRAKGQAIGSHRYTLLDQVIGANLDILFNGMEILRHHLFRVTRDADLTLDEDDADDLVGAIEEELRRRRFGPPVRLEVERSMPEEMREVLRRGLGLAEPETFEVRGMLDHTSLWQLVDLERPDLKSEPWTPVVPGRLLPPDED